MIVWNWIYGKWIRVLIFKREINKSALYYLFNVEIYGQEIVHITIIILWNKNYIQLYSPNKNIDNSNHI
mgnify:CR=1 FL=1